MAEKLCGLDVDPCDRQDCVCRVSARFALGAALDIADEGAVDAMDKLQALRRAAHAG
ncbi:MAG: hypothetical protein VW405_00770 [Rhodospirillaceae bacterium]